MDLAINRRRVASASAYPDMPGPGGYEAYIDINWFNARDLMLDKLTPAHATVFATGLAEMTKLIEEVFAAIKAGNVFQEESETIVAHG